MRADNQMPLKMKDKKEKLMRNVIGLGLVLISATAFAGRGGSNVAIQQAVASGSTDAVLAELERAEYLACLSCIDTVMSLVDDPAPRVREAAGWWLTKRGARVVVIQDMTNRLQGQDPTAARNAADVLRGMRDPATLPALHAYLANPLDEESGKAVVQAIGTIGSPNSLTALAGALKSPLAGVRSQATASLRDLRAPIGQKTVSTADATLMGLFADADASVRQQAAYTAGHWKDRAAVTPLAQLVAGDSSPQVRKAAAWALGEIGDGAARAALTNAQNDQDSLVRSIANAALGRLH
jgi:HEAT repeat protein